MQLAAQDNTAAVNPSWKNCKQLTQCQPPRVSRKIPVSNGRPGRQYIDSLPRNTAGIKTLAVVIDGTETVVTEKYSFNILNDTKVIYRLHRQGPSMRDPAGLAIQSSFTSKG